MNFSKQHGSFHLFPALHQNQSREWHEERIPRQSNKDHNSNDGSNENSPKLRYFLEGASVGAHLFERTRTERNTPEFGKAAASSAENHGKRATKTSNHKDDVKANVEAMFWNWISPRTQSIKQANANNASAAEPTVIPPKNDLTLAENVQSKLSGALTASSQHATEDILTLHESKKHNVDLGFGQRTSVYRGVTKHRWTGRFEAHLWDNTCQREGQPRKGKQVYLGGYAKEEKAARAYDLAALKYWGPSTLTNFPVSNYHHELEEMKHMSKQEYINYLRRNSSGFSRGASVYRGVTRHHQQGRWQARIGRVAGNKDLYLGTYSSQEEAAEAYDIAAIKYRGLNAVTNFDKSRYNIESIMSNPLPVGGLNKRLKAQESALAESIAAVHAIDEASTLTSQTHTNSYDKPSAESKATHEWPLLDYQHQENQLVASYLRQFNGNQIDQIQTQFHPPNHRQMCHMPSMPTSSGNALHNLVGLESVAIKEGSGTTPGIHATTSGIHANISDALSSNGVMMTINSSVTTSNSSILSGMGYSGAAAFGIKEDAHILESSYYGNLLSAQQSSGLGTVRYDKWNPLFGL